MARQSFRGAGGVGAVVGHHFAHAAGDYGRGAAGEYEVTAISQPVLADGDRRLEGVLAIVASGVLVMVSLLVAGWTLAG